MRCSTKTTRHRTGFTLIEVVVAIALLGTLLVAVVSARQRFLHQSADAADKSEAIAAANVLLTQWQTEWADLPRDASGELDSGLVWTTRVIETDIIPGTLDSGVNNDATPTVDLVRLSIQDTSATSGTEPLITIDLLHRLPPPDSAPTPEDEEIGDAS